MLVCRRYFEAFACCAGVTYARLRPARKTEHGSSFSISRMPPLQPLRCNSFELTRQREARRSGICRMPVGLPWLDGCPFMFVVLCVWDCSLPSALTVLCHFVSSLPRFPLVPFPCPSLVLVPCPPFLPCACLCFIPRSRRPGACSNVR